MKRIKVLIVDDSLLFREVLAKGIASDPGIEVVATASDPFDARDKLIRYEPDVMTCDVEMPRMNGIEFVRRLMPQYPLPVIVVSVASQRVFDAMGAGAVDFVSKPDVTSPAMVESFIRELIVKVKIASVSNLSTARIAPVSVKPPAVMPTPVKPAAAEAGAGMLKLIAIGASTGGTEALFRLLKALPERLPGIVVAQHIPPVFSRMLAERLNSSTPFRVEEAQTGDVVESGRVLIAPGNRHMKVRRAGELFKVECVEGARVNGHCPSVDVLFDSVAREAGCQALGIILTGMGYDGAKGLLAMRRKGARTIGQDEASSVVYGMPKAAYEIGAVEKQAALSLMPQLIQALIQE